MLFKLTTKLWDFELSTSGKVSKLSIYLVGSAGIKNWKKPVKQGYMISSTTQVYVQIITQWLKWRGSRNKESRDWLCPSIIIIIIVITIILTSSWSRCSKSQFEFKVFTKLALMGQVHTPIHFPCTIDTYSLYLGLFSYIQTSDSASASLSVIIHMYAYMCIFFTIIESCIVQVFL